LSTDAGSVRVSIFNHTYNLRSASGDGEQVARVARLVDERMRLIASGLAVHDVAKIAVLTALNLADELEGLRDFYERELREMLSRAHEKEEDVAPADVAVGEAERDDAAEPSAVEAVAEGRATRDEQSWFDAIFDTDTPGKTGDERLSSQVSQRLRSQVSSRLRRLRQSPPGNSITDGEGGGPVRRMTNGDD
jgi:cell division protein ZapA